MKKGDFIIHVGIWSISDFDLTAVIYTRRLKVESWGKKQATLTDAETGAFIKESVGVNHFLCCKEGESAIPLLGQVKDQIRSRQKAQLGIQKAWLAEYECRAGKPVVERARKQLEAMEAGIKLPIDVADYNDLCNRIKRRL